MMERRCVGFNDGLEDQLVCNDWTNGLAKEMRHSLASLFLLSSLSFKYGHLLYLPLATTINP